MSGDVFFTSFSEFCNCEFYNEFFGIPFIKGNIDCIHDADPAIRVQLFCNILRTAGFLSRILLFYDFWAECRSLPEDCGRTGGDFIQGTNSWSTKFGPYADIPKNLTLRFGGPAPGDARHEYETTIYALDRVLNIKEGFYFSQLRKAMRGHVLAEAVMYALY